MSEAARGWARCCARRPWRVLARLGLATVVISSVSLTLVSSPALAETGQVTEFAVGARGAVDIASGSDGNLWFTQAVDGVGRITPSGDVTEYTQGITPGSSPHGTETTGPDGNVWYAELAGNRVARVTPQGVTTEFGDGISPGSQPVTVARGPDGNMWFTELLGDRIGRVTMDGTITEFEIPTKLNTPAHIAPGPLNSMWFTEAALAGATHNSKIGQITMDGVITEYPLGPDVAADGIIAGPDGNLWYADQNGGVGRMTPTGEVTRYKDGIPGGTAAIQVGPDGNLWFTGEGIGRITPDGDVTMFTEGISGSPIELTVGPDGNIWFTETSMIGRLAVDRSPETPADPANVTPDDAAAALATQSEPRTGPSLPATGGSASDAIPGLVLLVIALAGRRMHRLWGSRART